MAAIVAVLGFSASSQAGLLAEIQQLGTNLLTVGAGTTISGQVAQLPVAAPAMISRLTPVESVADTAVVPNNAQVYRSPLIPVINTNALQVQATSLNLPSVIATSVAKGSYLNAATANEPVAVLGASAAEGCSLGVPFALAGGVHGLEAVIAGNSLGAVRGEL